MSLPQGIVDGIVSSPFVKDAPFYPMLKEIRKEEFKQFS
jgi:hypothetical protein